MTRPARGFLLGALVGVAAAAFLFAWLRRRERPGMPPSYNRPQGGEREGDFELFIGS